MSKFFQVLERAEQNRTHKRQQGETGPIEAVSDTSVRRLAVVPTKAQADTAWSNKLSHPEARPAAKPARENPERVEPHLVSLLAPETFEAEQYRSLGNILEQTRHATGLSIVAVSSPTVGDGKTTTAINLAAALTQTNEARVLLVDADLRQPALPSLLGLSHVPDLGLTDAIQDPRLSLNDVVQLCPQFHLSVLPAGSTVAAPDRTLNVARLGTLFEEARHSYDYVIVDTPPLIPFSDCQRIEKWVDGFLVVVAAHRTPRNLVEEALAAVDSAKLVTLVFNGDDQLASEYYASYAYGSSSKSSWIGRFSQRIKKVIAAL